MRSRGAGPEDRKRHQRCGAQQEGAACRPQGELRAGGPGLSSGYPGSARAWRSRGTTVPTEETPASLEAAAGREPLQPVAGVRGRAGAGPQCAQDGAQRGQWGHCQAGVTPHKGKPRRLGARPKVQREVSRSPRRAPGRQAWASGCRRARRAQQSRLITSRPDTWDLDVLPVPAKEAAKGRDRTEADGCARTCQGKSRAVGPPGSGPWPRLSGSPASAQSFVLFLCKSFLFQPILAFHPPLFCLFWGQSCHLKCQILCSHICQFPRLSAFVSLGKVCPH